MTRAAAAAELFPGCCAPALHGWSRAEVRAHAEFLRRSTFLREVVPATGVPFQCVCVKAARLLLPHMQEPACIHCSTEDLPRWTPSRGWWCALRSACGSIQPTHESAEND